MIPIIIIYISTTLINNIEKKKINIILDNLHKYASEANGKMYFDLFNEDAVFFGTDASERWTINKFKDYFLILSQIMPLIDTFYDNNSKIGIWEIDNNDKLSKYNQWLSERRAQRTVDYVVSKGISKDRIVYEAFGETQLANECADGVYCTEEKHSKNRRSEFLNIEF